MEKILIGAGIGIFIGAFAMEILHRTYPEAFKNIETGVGTLATSLSTAFMEGYKDSVEPEPAPSAG